ncbi:MAG: oligoribonuclease [Burkholderiaceae bacterium]|nr:oligoribonuclease [Burkholderiaceae bacterium]
MSQQSAPPGAAPASANASATPRTPDESLLVWVDMEMTGLNPVVDRIIEVAIVVTDESLKVVAQGEAIAIRQPAAVLDAMDQWNRSTHGRSGLVDRVLASTWTEASAEQALLDFLAPLVPPGKSPMCGNSICQDRRFMARYMPRLEAWFHYRNIDVSTLKELCRRWRPEVAKAFSKRSAHTALADIAESIDELRHYRDGFLSIAPRT